MTLVGYVAMACIIAVLAWPLRGTTLWPLALPIALAFGEAGFVQTWDLQVQLPGFPVPLSWLDIVFVALLVAWLLVRRVSRPPKVLAARGHWHAAPLVAWLVMVALAVPLAWIDGGAIKLGISWSVLAYAYVPLSVAILWDVLRRTDRAALWVLLRSLSVVVSVLAVFYTFHMLGLSLYDLAGVNSTYSGVGEVRRDVLTFPVWACVTVPFLLWRERIRLVDGLMIVVQCIAVAMSLTRSLVLALGLAFLLLVVWRVAANRRPFQPLVVAAVGAASFTVLLWTVPAFVARAVDLLSSRFDELAAGVASVPNVVSRLDVGTRISSFLSGWGLWMGAGFSDAAIAQTQANVGRQLVADSLWSLILLRFGVIGVVVIAATLAMGVGTGLVAALKRRREPLAIAVVVAAALAWLCVRTAASSEIVANYPVVCAFLLAIVLVEERGAWSDSREVRRLLFDGGDTPSLPDWVPRSGALKAMALVLLVVVEITLGRAIAR